MFIVEFFKKVGKVQVGLNKIALKHIQGIMLVIRKQLSHFSPSFFPW